MTVTIAELERLLHLEAIHPQYDYADALDEGDEALGWEANPPRSSRDMDTNGAGTWRTCEQQERAAVDGVEVWRCFRRRIAEPATTEGLQYAQLSVAALGGQIHPDYEFCYHAVALPSPLHGLDPVIPLNLVHLAVTNLNAGLEADLQWTFNPHVPGGGWSITAERVGVQLFRPLTLKGKRV